MRRRPLQVVVETPEFLRRVRGLLSDDERRDLIDHIAAYPEAGDVMVESGGARKVRWQAKGKGKSGGVRAITFHSGPTVPVFLMTVFAKGEKANLSKAERNALRRILGDLVEAYRKGAKSRVQSR